MAWKIAVAGRGWSSPVIADGQIWLTTALDDGHSLRAVGIDAQTGKIIREVEVFRPEEPAPINAKNSHASPTSVLEKGRLYVHFGRMGTACVETATGRVLWTNNELVIQHKEGPGSSPIPYGDLLLINCDGMDFQYVVALDKQTGRIKWKTGRTGEPHPKPDFRKAYATGLIVPRGDHQQLISPGAHQVISYRPDTGEELWKVRYDGFSNVPRPLYGHGMVYVCSGFMRPVLLAIRPDGSGDVTDSHVVWEQPKSIPRNPSPILVGDRIYFAGDRGVAVCLDAHTGAEIWTERLGGNFSASPIYADGRIYFPGEQGETTVIAPGDTFQKLAVNQLDGRIQASPAVVDRSIILRTETHLYRLEKRP